MWLFSKRAIQPIEPRPSPHPISKTESLPLFYFSSSFLPIFDTKEFPSFLSLQRILDLLLSLYLSLFFSLLHLVFLLNTPLSSCVLSSFSPSSSSSCFHYSSSSLSALPCVSSFSMSLAFIQKCSLLSSLRWLSSTSSLRAVDAPLRRTLQSSVEARCFQSNRDDARKKKKKRDSQVNRDRKRLLSFASSCL